MMSQEINKGLVIKVTDEELLKNRRDYSGDERKSDHTKREIDRSSNPRFRTRLDKGYGIFIENMLKQVNLPEMCG